MTITPVFVGDLLAEDERMPVYVHVIDHPDARVLVDTGMTELHPAAADMDPRIRPLSEQPDFDLAGIDDHSAGRMLDGHGSDLVKALEGRDAGRACVLLAHQPRGVELADELGVDLQLSGHTHGGQIFPWNLAVRLQQPFVAGLHRLTRAQIYVSMGTGYWGPPMRVGAPAEITEIELVGASESA